MRFSAPVDRRVLHLIKMWLECAVEETDERGRKTRTTEARDNRRGIPQGSPISPLLANLYMRRFTAPSQIARMDGPPPWRVERLNRDDGNRVSSTELSPSAQPVRGSNEGWVMPTKQLSIALAIIVCIGFGVARPDLKTFAAAPALRRRSISIKSSPMQRPRRRHEPRA
jgi:hypothetical protein